MDRPKIACVFPPNFMRAVMAVGAAKCLWGNGIIPEMITGCSGGGLAAASVAGWDKRVIQGSADIWSSLRPGKISEFKLAEEAFLVSFLSGPVLHLAPDILSERYRYLEKGAKVLFSLAVPGASFWASLRQSSVFSNKPLRELLLKNLSFQKIFDSPIKILVVSADIADGTRVCHTNFLEEDRLLDEALRRDRLISGLLGSAAIPGLFPPSKFENRFLIDGVFAHDNFLAIDLIEKYCDCDFILVFMFYSMPKIQTLKGVLDIVDHTNELMVRDKTFSILENLPGKTRDKLIIIELEEPPEKIGLRDFSKNDMRRMIELGYSATERFLKEHDWI